MICTRCGQDNTDAAAVCHRCGRKLQSFFNQHAQGRKARGEDLPLLTLSHASLGRDALMRCVEAWAWALLGLGLLGVCLVLEKLWPLYALGPVLLLALHLRRM